MVHWILSDIFKILKLSGKNQDKNIEFHKFILFLIMSDQLVKKVFLKPN